MAPLFIFLGPPGSGKGTQGRKLQAKFDLPYLATGDLVRKMSSRAGTGDSFYDHIKERKDAGIPQPDDVIFQIMERQFQEIDLGGGIIFDSFPLSRGQAEWLESKRSSLALEVPIVFYIALSEESAVSRLGKRKYCPTCHRSFLPGTRHYEENRCSDCGRELIVRDDDTPTVVAHRYQEYTERLRDIINFYQEKNWLYTINGEVSVEEVTKQIEQVVSHLTRSSHDRSQK